MLLQERALSCCNSLGALGWLKISNCVSFRFFFCNLEFQIFMYPRFKKEKLNFRVSNKEEHIEFHFVFNMWCTLRLKNQLPF